MENYNFNKYTVSKIFAMFKKILRTYWENMAKIKRELFNWARKLRSDAGEFFTSLLKKLRKIALFRKFP